MAQRSMMEEMDVAKLHRAALSLTSVPRPATWLWYGPPPSFQRSPWLPTLVPEKREKTIENAKP